MDASLYPIGNNYPKQKAETKKPVFTGFLRDVLLLRNEGTTSVISTAIASINHSWLTIKQAILLPQSPRLILPELVYQPVLPAP